MYKVHVSYRYNRSKAKILHRIKLNIVIQAGIFSFLYKRAPNTKEKREHLTSLTFDARGVRPVVYMPLSQRLSL